MDAGRIAPKGSQPNSLGHELLTLFSPSDTISFGKIDSLLHEALKIAVRIWYLCLDMVERSSFS